MIDRRELLKSPAPLPRAAAEGEQKGVGPFLPRLSRLREKPFKPSFRVVMGLRPTRRNESQAVVTPA
jgi:hypothetical protein